MFACGSTVNASEHDVSAHQRKNTTRTLYLFLFVVEIVIASFIHWVLCSRQFWQQWLREKNNIYAGPYDMI